MVIFIGLLVSVLFAAIFVGMCKIIALIMDGIDNVYFGVFIAITFISFILFMLFYSLACLVAVV